MSKCPFDHPLCQQCWKEVTTRFDGEFRIRCHGIKRPEDIIPPHLLSQFSEEEREMAYGLYDPVIWAKKHFNWEPRVSRDGLEYQALMLRCTAPRKVFRCGRRVGKCLHPSAMVMTEAGPVPVADLFDIRNRPRLLTFDPLAHTLRLTDEYYVWANGRQSLLRLTTKSGRSTMVTDNHPFLKLRQDGGYMWLQARELRPGMRIAAPASYAGLIAGRELGIEAAGQLGRECALAGSSTLPLEILQGTEADIAHFLGAYWQHCGWLHAFQDGRVRIWAKASTQQAARGLQHLLLRLGVFAELQQRDTDWRVLIQNQEDAVRFIQAVPLSGTRAEMAAMVMERLCLDPTTLPAVHRQVMWDEVVSIEPAGEDVTYDLTVPGTHTLIADDLISHNSTTIAVRLLHFMSTNAHGKVLLVTPFKAQIDIIFDMVEEFIAASPALQSSIKRKVSNPYHELEFHNGSYLRGFTSGTKSGAEAGSIRGQAADIVILDECDYLNDGDINSITAILHDHPNTQLWASSTPTGRRGKFYEWCNSPRYKEFHYSSHVLPHWDEEMDAEQRENLTELAYKHEILAEWGEEEEGVFQKQYIEAALSDYTYADCHPIQGWVYGMGIDWNSEAFGTEIVVVGFNGEKLKVVETVNISRIGWNQLTAIEKVIALNRKWQPLFIKADEGYGNLAVEVLKKYGLDQRGKNEVDARLAQIVEGVNFSSRIEVPDPITKEKVKKPLKPFMVENATRIFERGSIEISKHDTILVSQLENYIIKRRTESGVPVYCARQPKIGDHKLDGLMLALLGFTEQFSDLMRVNYTTIVRFAGKLGEGYAKQQQLEQLQPSVIVEDPRLQMERHGRAKRSGFHDRMQVSPQALSPLVGLGNPWNASARLWKWPGFMRDEPPPQRRQKVMNRPSRRNI